MSEMSAVDLGDLELLAIGVDGQAPHQRLVVLGEEDRPKTGVKAREEVVRLLTIVVEPDREVTPEPLHGLGQADVVVGRVRLGDDSPIELRPGRVALRRRVQIKGEGGAVEGQLLCDIEVNHLRVDPLDRDVEVAVQGSLDGVVQREVVLLELRCLTQEDRALADEPRHPVRRRGHLGRRSTAQAKYQDQACSATVSSDHDHPPPMKTNCLFVRRNNGEACSSREPRRPPGAAIDANSRT